MQMYTQFSFLLDLGSEELAKEACEAMTSSIDGLDDGEEPVWDELAEAMQGEEPSLFQGIDFSVEDGGIWFRHSDSGNPIGAAILVQAIMKRNGIADPFGFTFAEVPSGKQYDCFTGGALFITRDEIDGMNAVTWLGDKMNPPSKGEGQ